jgi:CheY-like chemotaxis protein
VSRIYRVAFLGFSDFERRSLAHCFSLSAGRALRFEPAPWLPDADFLVADADDTPSVQLVLTTERLAHTVFVGAQAPTGRAALLPRPAEPTVVLRELDALVRREQRSTPPLRPVRPVRLAAAAGARPSNLPSAAVEPGVTSSQRHALLVDDSEIALLFLRSRLLRWGLQIDSADCSDRALTLLAEKSYDFAFLDVELGPASSLDGLSLCQHIKQSAAAVTTTVVMVTAHQRELDRVRGAFAGCDAYLGKPLDEVELQRLLMRSGLKAMAAGPPTQRSGR